MRRVQEVTRHSLIERALQLLRAVIVAEAAERVLRGAAHFLVRVFRQGDQFIEPRAAGLASRLDILAGGVIARSVRKGEMDANELAALYRQVTHG